MPSTSASRLPPLDAARAQQFNSDIKSGDALRLRHSVEVPSAAPLSASAVTQLKALGWVTFDLATFTQTGDETASVAASSSGGRWKVDLIRVNARWMIAATEPAQ